MINVNDNVILNPDNVVIAEQKGSMYRLTLINGKTLYVNKDVYEDIIAYEPASKEYVDSKLSGALKRLIVQALPTEDIDVNTIYMVLDSGSSQQGNVYNEYMYINNAWELIGTTKASGPVYSAGTNVSIENNVISATDTTYTAGDNITIENGVISASGGSSTEIYEHNIRYSNTTLYSSFTLKIITNSSTPFDYYTLRAWLYNNDFREYMGVYNASGLNVTMPATSIGELNIIYGVRATIDNILLVCAHGADNNHSYTASTNITFTDTNIIDNIRQII